MRTTNHHTGEGCKAAGLCMQAEATRGERSKVTIADVIERANGDHYLSPHYLGASSTSSAPKKSSLTVSSPQKTAIFPHSSCDATKRWPAQLPALGFLHCKVGID